MKTKVIALLPMKNEECHLPTYMDSISLVADKLIVVDDHSTDNSVNIISEKAHKRNLDVDIHNAVRERGHDWSVDRTRQLLLNLGREAGGTHFICLDADECFTKPFSLKARRIFEAMAPGSKVLMSWLAIWKSIDHYKNDNSVWSNNNKDFIFCDNRSFNFEKDTYFCDPRTPGPNNENNTLLLNPKHGAIMHFQFSNWDKFQIKQCWYRCREKAYGKPSQAINQKYSITLDDPNSIVSEIPNEWMPEHDLPKIEHNFNNNNWHIQEIEMMFKQHGVDMFKDLDIWHCEQIKKLLK